MTKEQLFKLVVEVSSELESVKCTLDNTPHWTISHSDVEDVSDAYQARLEYNWWVDEQKGLIKSLEKELSSYQSQLDELDKSL